MSEHDEAPLQFFTCDICGGEGFIARRITVYEPGCGFPHDDTAEETCRECNGLGGWVADAETDKEIRRGRWRWIR